MNLKNVSWVLPLFLAISCSQTPSINTKPIAANKIIGTVSLGIGENAGGSSVHISPRVALADNAVTFGTPTYNQIVDTNTNIHYLYAIFPITNNTASAFTNLTLYAYAKNGASIGGTAIEGMINFNGGATSSNAQSLSPIHKTDLVLGVPTIDSTNADFQAFNVDDVATLTIGAQALTTVTALDTILQYGFVARNSTGGRAIAANGGTGTITIAYQVPDSNVAAAYKFKADFVLADDTLNTRVTRGLGDTTLAADARATLMNADEVFLVGDDTDIPVNTSFRVTNILTGISPTCLVSTLACQIATTATVTGGGTGNLGIAYNVTIDVKPAAGTEITAIDIDYGDGNPLAPFSLATNATSDSYTYTVAGTYDVLVDATDNNGDTATSAPSQVIIAP
jgi:hypothetical protein